MLYGIPLTPAPSAGAAFFPTAETIGGFADVFLDARDRILGRGNSSDLHRINTDEPVSTASSGPGLFQRITTASVSLFGYSVPIWLLVAVLVVVAVLAVFGFKMLGAG